jgi:nucleoside-diphosphate-sugar epimerase
MRIAVIGGSGFLGSSLCRILKNNEKHFVNYDINKSLDFPDDYEYFSVENKNSDFKSSFNAIINLAAIHRDDERKEDYHKVNVEGARNICDLASKRSINKIIFTSTVAIYGFSNDPIDEDFNPNPFNDYGRSKLEAEEIYKEWQREDPIKRSLVIIRPTVIFGENNRGNVFNLIKQIKSKFFVMIGDGNNIKSMSYVENVAQFLYQCLELKEGLYIKNYVDKPDLKTKDIVRIVQKSLSIKQFKKFYLPINIGLFAGILVDFLSSLTGKKFPISLIRVKKFTSNTIINSNRNFFNFNPPVSLDDALEKTITYEFKSNVEIL